MSEQNTAYNAAGVDASTTAVANPGKLLFFSGIYATDKNEEIFGVGAVQMQVKQILENLHEVLTKQGITFEHIVKATLYLHKELDFDEGAGVLPQFLKAFKNPPPYTCLYVYGFLHQEALVCVDVIAAR